MLKLLFVFSAFLAVNLGVVEVASAAFSISKNADSAHSSEVFPSLQKQLISIQGLKSQNNAVYQPVSDDATKHDSSCECKPTDKDCHCSKEVHHLIK